MERKFFEDNELIHAVIECNYKKVKELVQGKYSKPIYDIGGWEKQCPIYIISKCYDIIFNENPDIEVFKKLKNDNTQILNLFISQFGLGNIEDLMIEDYTGAFFDDEEDRIADYTEEPTNFDITQDLNKTLWEEVTDNRRHSILKKLCELGADPYHLIEDEDEEIISFTADDVQMGTVFVRAMLEKPLEVYSLYDIVEIIALVRNMQNYDIMASYVR